MYEIYAEPCNQVDKEEPQQECFEGIANVFVEGVPRFEGHFAFNDGFREKLRILAVVVTILVNEGAYAAVCNAGDGHAVFDSTVTYKVQMVAGGGASAEPAIVCNVDHEPGSFTGGFTDEVPEDCVVADVRSPMVEVVDGRFVPRDEVSFTKIHVVQDGKDVVKGNSFAERYKMLLDVTLGLCISAGGEHKGGVVDFVAARSVWLFNSLVVQGANEYVGILVGGELLQFAQNPGLAADVVRYGCFCHENDISVICNGIVCHSEGLCDDGVKTFLAPFGALGDTWLYECDYGSLVVLFNVEGLCLGTGKDYGTMNEKGYKNEYRNKDWPFLFDAFTADAFFDNHVRSDDDHGVPENADDGKRLDQFQLVPENIAEVAPGEAEIAAGTRHFKAGIKQREKNEQPGLPLDLDVLCQGVGECCKDVIGAEIGNEQEYTQTDKAGWCRFHVHDIVDPVVVDGIEQHAGPECGEDGRTAVVTVQYDEPGNQKNERCWAKRERRERQRVEPPCD